jgi:hypothetical protein
MGSRGVLLQPNRSQGAAHDSRITRVLSSADAACSLFTTTADTVVVFVPCCVISVLFFLALQLLLPGQRRRACGQIR